MNTKDLIITANRNLLRNKLRTLLTVLAIFVGALTLTLTNGLGDGLKDYIETQVKNYEGDSVVFINKKPKMELAEAKNEPQEYSEKTDAAEAFDPNSMVVTPEQIERLGNEFPEVKSISPNYSVRSEYITLDGVKKFAAAVNAVGLGIVQKLEAGRQIDDDRQIILQYDLAKILSNDFQSLVGKQAAIGYKAGASQEMQLLKLTVVGVATKGMIGSPFSSIDAKTEKQIYEAQSAGTPGYDKILNFSFQLNTSDAKAIESVKNRLSDKGFEAMTLADKSKRTYDAIGIFQIGMNLFAGIALLAASFGIINTLVIAVMERTKEIGLQKALGMGRGKVFFLFSLESILIGFWGAVLGIGTAMILGSIANSYASKYFLESFEGYRLIAFKPASLLLIVAAICSIAFIAGVMPAFRASRLNPIEALRYE